MLYFRTRILNNIFGAISRRKLTPYSSISIAITHATTYASTTTNLPNVIWSGDNELLLEGERILWRDYQDAFTQEVEDTEQFLFEQVLLGETLLDLKFEVDHTTHIFDDLSNTNQGYSLFDDPRNPFRGMVHNLTVRFFKSARARHLHKGRVSQGQVVWDDAGTSDWLISCEQFSRRLIFLAHGAGGQPGRGVEVGLTKVYNPFFRMRNLHAIGAGRIVYVLYYGKTTGNTGKDRVIAHALPWRIGRMLLIYHALVNPLVGVLVERVAPAPARSIQIESAFASYGREVTSDQLSLVIQNWFEKKLNVQIRLRLFRQFIIACQRRLMLEAFSPVKRALNIVDAQAGHSTETAEQHYAIEASEVHFLSGDTVLKYIAASARWCHVLFAHRQDLLTAPELKAGLDAPNVIAEIDDLPHVGRAVQLRPEDIRSVVVGITEEGAFASAVSRLILAGLAQAGIGANPAALAATRTRSVSVLPVPDQQEYFGARPAAAIVRAKHLVGLRRFLGSSTATWTSQEQAQALVHILERKTSLLCVLPTGGGKSALFGAIPYLESGVTVVVFPLRALLHDQLAAFKRRDPNRPMLVWSAELELTEGLVAATVEQIETAPFLRWCTSLNARHLLSRIVLDECHLIVSASTYRPVMDNLQSLGEARVPLVCLSATVPPVLEEGLRKRLGSPRWQVLRARTQRPNIHLRASQFASRGDAMHALCKHVRRYQTLLRPGEGILIQCRNYHDVDDLAKALKIPKYTSSLPAETKDLAAEQWVNGTHPIIVATSALGTGVHHPHCRYIIHLGLSFGTVPYNQELGRAGRDGKPSLAHMFYWRPYPTPPEIDLEGYLPMVEMMDAYDCMRIHMSRYLDGASQMVSCSSLGQAECGRCVVDMQLATRRHGTALGGHDGPDQHARIYGKDEWVSDIPELVERADENTAPRLPLAQNTQEVLHDVHREEVAQATIQRDRDVGAAVAPPPEQIGEMVLADAQAAIARRAAPPIATEDEQSYGNMSFPKILEVKSAVENCCISCLVNGVAASGHYMFKCFRTQDYALRDGTLDGYPVDGRTFKQFKTYIKDKSLLPRDSSICFVCFWPASTRHGHSAGRPPKSCTMTDRVLPSCWLVYHRPEIRMAMLNALNAPASAVSFEGYAEWLCTPHRRLDWRDVAGAVYNAQRVFVWLCLEHYTFRLL